MNKTVNYVEKITMKQNCLFATVATIIIINNALDFCKCLRKPKIGFAMFVKKI